MQRRQYLATVGIATSSALAGCGSDTGSNGTGDGGGETAGGGGGTELSTPASGEEATTAASDGAGETAATEPTQSEVVTSAREPSPTAGGSASTSTATSGGGSASSSVSIDSSEFVKETEYGMAEAAMVGELTAPTHLQSIELRATFRNDAGDVLTSDSAYFQGLNEGQTWSFYVPMLGEAADATEGEVEVVAATAGSPPPSPQAEIVESELNPSPDEFTGPTVSARARNTGSSTLPYLEARVKFLADDGTALDSDFNNVTDLPAGETWSFEVEQIVFSSDSRPEASDFEITLAV